MITLAKAKKLQYGDILIDKNGKRWKVSGMVRRWKTMPDRIYIPLKHGLYTHDHLTDADFHNGKCNLLTLEEVK